MGSDGASGPESGDAARPPRSRQEQRHAYLQGHRRNPLTTTELGARVLSASQLLWFLLWPPRGFGVLTTIGRKSGKKRRKCVRAIRDGDRAYLVSLRGPYAAWVQNLRANPEVQLRLRGGTLAGTAREISDPEERRRVHDVYCGTLNPFDRAAYRMHRTGRLTPSGIRSLLEQWFSVGTPVVIEF